MARMSPLGKIKDMAIDTLRNPLGAAGKAVDHARETAALGKDMAGQATRTATGTAMGAASAVGHLVPGHRKPASSVPDTAPAPRPVSEAPAKKAAPRTAVPKASFVNGPEPTMTTADPTTHEAGPAPINPVKPAAKKSPARKPAPAKPPGVDVTPADVAKNMGTDPTVEPAPGADQPAATPAPGDKLPPRRKAPASKAPTPKPPSPKAAAPKAAAPKTAAAPKAAAPDRG